MRCTAVCSLLTIALLNLLTFSACQKDLLGTDPEETEAVVEDCPNFGALVASQNVENEALKTEQLLAFFSPGQIADLKANTCLTRDQSTGAVEDRAAGVKNKFWTPGATIRVRFLNGSPALQQKVFDCATAWEAYANIHFQRVNSGASDVRILFGSDGHWSYIGTDNRGIEACAETMNLELKDNTQANEIRRVALHEFGHVLGLRHEHQQPLAAIPWNTTAVYNYYAQQDWDKATVDDQILNKNAAETTQHTAFDAQSIMEYPVAAALTTNGFSIPWNTQLSATDKSFIGLMYSTQRIRVRHAVSNFGNITFLMNGIYHTLRSGESLPAPAFTSGNQLAIKEVSGNWDTGYAPVYGKHYKLVRVGSSNDLTLAVE